MEPGELTCKELVELVTLYLEGALPPAEVARFEAHLGECRGCSTYIEQMRQTIRLVGELREDSISDTAEVDLRHAFRQWKEGG
jgi:anti-sigma factor RsiW